MSAEYASPPPGAPQPPHGFPVAKKRRPRYGLWILLFLVIGVVLICVVGLVLLVAVGLAAGGTGVKIGVSGAGRSFTEHTVDGTGSNKILLIPVTGVISDMPETTFLGRGPGLVSTVRAMLKAARNDDDIKAVLLHIDSPGGGVTASDVLHRALTDYREQTGIQVIALLGDVAASGGYYVAAASDYIVAHPTTLTGSIGVVIPLIGFEGLMQKIGVESRPVKSGRLKDIGSGYRDITEEERKILQGIVDEMHRHFVDVVFKGMETRGIAMTREQLDSYCDGRIFSGKEAKRLGFVDDVGYFDQAVQTACTRAGIPRADTRVVTYQPKAGLLDLLTSKLATPGSPNLTIEIKGLTDAQTPRFLYLWTVGRPRIIHSSR